MVTRRGIGTPTILKAAVVILSGFIRPRYLFPPAVNSTMRSSFNDERTDSKECPWNSSTSRVAFRNTVCRQNARKQIATCPRT